MSRLPPKGSSSGDVLSKIKKAPPLSNDLLEAMSEVSLPVQVTFLRRHYGISQQELAAAISMKQAHYSRLERKDSDHRISTYQKVAQLLRSRLVVLPRGAKIVMP
jgi:ribosome-binding protein aMBF1 (putative translation factor)